MNVKQRIILKLKFVFFVIGVSIFYIHYINTILNNFNSAYIKYTLIALSNKVTDIVKHEHKIYGVSSVTDWEKTYLIRI